MTKKRVRPPVVAITELDAREALAKPLLALCSIHGPKKVALTLGMNEKNVRNARDEKSTLRIDRAFNMLVADEFALEPLLAKFRRRSVPIDAICSTDDCTLPLVALLHAFIEMERATSDGGKRKTRAELKKAEGLLREVNELTGALLAQINEPIAPELRLAS